MYPVGVAKPSSDCWGGSRVESRWEMLTQDNIQERDGIGHVKGGVDCTEGTMG